MSSPRFFYIHSLNAVHQISFLDYIFNPCGLMSIEMTIDAPSYEQFFKGIGKDQPVFVKILLGTRYVSGQVVSHQVAKTGAVVVSFFLSMLLMPIGAAEPCSMPEKINSDSLPGSAIKSPSGQFSVYAQYRDRFEDHLDWDKRRLMSAMGQFSLWRKHYAQKGYQKYLASKDSDSVTMWHRIAYFMFASEPAVSMNGAPPAASKFLWGDVALQAPASSASSFTDLVLKGNTDQSVSYASGSQGLLNSAFAHIPQTSNSYQNIIGHLINETFTITVKGLLSPGLAALDFIPTASADNPKLFDVFTAYPPPGAEVTPPWGRGDVVVHLKTLYTYVDDETMGSTGHTVQYVLGRFNPKLCPF